MKKRLDLIFLSAGVFLFLCAMLGTLLVHHTGSGAFLWLLIPSFPLIGIGGDRKVWRNRKAEAAASSDSIWFAPPQES